MKRTTIVLLVIAASFFSGFTVKTILTRPEETQKTGRVTGIGGIFFKCKDPGKMNAWYKTHLGVNTNQYGAVFEWRLATDSTKKGFTEWNPFKESTKYFEPSTKDFMINYRVDNLQALVGELKKEGVTVTDTMETYDYGKFIHILDVEGNKLELWEPNDVAFDKMGKALGATTTK